MGCREGRGRSEVEVGVEGKNSAELTTSTILLMLVIVRYCYA